MKKRLSGLLRNSRFYILITAVWFSVVVYYALLTILPNQESLRLIRTQQVYGFTAVMCLYAALLVSPVMALFPDTRVSKELFHARRAIGVSCFYFALLHACIAFFGQLDGFSGLGFYASSFRLSLLLGLGALVALFLMAVTSFDLAMRVLTFKRWKMLHRVVYIAAYAAVWHIMIIGSHVTVFNGFTLFMLGGGVLVLIAEALRVLLVPKKSRFRKMVIGVWVLVLIATGYFTRTLMPIAGNKGVSVHGGHSSATTTTTETKEVSLQLNNPVTVGKYKVSLVKTLYPLETLRNSSAKLTFKVTDASDVEVPDLVVRPALIQQDTLKPIILSETAPLTYDINGVISRDDIGLYRAYLYFTPDNEDEMVASFSLWVSL